MDSKWYATILWACELNADLEQLPRGDLTVVGSNGAGLSGGQKQRIVRLMSRNTLNIHLPSAQTLARAFYSRRKVILLDDIFSGIDTNTTNLIAQRLFGTRGLARQSKTTVLLATHNRKQSTRFISCKNNDTLTSISKTKSFPTRMIFLS